MTSVFVAESLWGIWWDASSAEAAGVEDVRKSPGADTHDAVDTRDAVLADSSNAGGAESEDASDTSGMATGTSVIVEGAGDAKSTSVVVGGAGDAEDEMSNWSYTEGILMPLVTGRGRGRWDCTSGVLLDSILWKRGGDDMKESLPVAESPL